MKSGGVDTGEWASGYIVLDNKWLNNDQLEPVDLGVLWLMAAQVANWKFHYFWLIDKTGLSEKKLRTILKRLGEVGLTRLITNSQGKGKIERYYVLDRAKVIVKGDKPKIIPYDDDDSSSPF